ncbi:septum formation initiator family protein [Patescibacteria group bacterium]|nr:septum formation initiator family protein [Patescibacteria group bacterium]MBU1612933.1 septum formation initiator family protein [Patescibacteria group bacterium]
MMMEHRKKSFLRSRLFLLVIFLGSILIAFAYGRAYYQDMEVRKEIARLQNEVKSLEVKKMETLDVLKYVKSPAFAEEKARLELNMAKPGEKMAVVAGKSAVEKQGGQEAEKELELDSIPNIIKWWNFFVGDENY